RGQRPPPHLLRPRRVLGGGGPALPVARGGAPAGAARHGVRRTPRRPAEPTRPDWHRRDRRSLRRSGPNLALRLPPADASAGRPHPVRTHYHPAATGLLR